MNDTIVSGNILTIFYFLDLLRQIQAQRAPELAYCLQTFRQKRSKVSLQGLSVLISDATRSKESREVTFTGQDQLCLLPLRLQRLKIDSAALSEASQHRQHLQMCLRRDVRIFHRFSIAQEDLHWKRLSSNRQHD